MNERSTIENSELIAVLVSSLAGALIARALFGRPSLTTAVMVGAVVSALVVIVAMERADGAPDPSRPSEAAATPWSGFSAVASPVLDRAPVDRPAAQRRNSAPVVLDDYLEEPALRPQCPSCGGFEMTRTGATPMCGRCRRPWTWSTERSSMSLRIDLAPSPDPSSNC